MIDKLANGNKYQKKKKKKKYENVVAKKQANTKKLIL